MRINGIEYFEHYNTARLLAPEPQPYSLQPVSRAFGFKWVNDSFSQTANRLWYALSEISGRAILIVHSSVQINAAQKPLLANLLTEKVTAIISLTDMCCDSDALSHFVPVLVKVKTIAEAVRAAKRLSKPQNTILYCPSVSAMASGFCDYESRGLEFNRQLNLIS